MPLIPYHNFSAFLRRTARRRGDIASFTGRPGIGLLPDYRVTGRISNREKHLQKGISILRDTWACIVHCTQKKVNYFEGTVL